jgi:hypothetical protein
VGLAIAALAHPLFSHGFIAALLCRIRKPRAWLPLALPPALAIGAIVGYVSWTYWPKPWLIEDLLQLAEYHRARDDRVNFIANFVHFYSQDFFHLGTLFCLLLCCCRRLYPISIWALVASGLLLRNRQNLTVFYYQAITLVPIFALAWAGGLLVLARMLRQRLRERRFHRTLLHAAFLLPVAVICLQVPAVVQGRLIPRNQIWVTQSIPEVEHAASWLNDRTSPYDLVIANPNIAWLLKAKTADFLQATLWQGYPTQYFAIGISRERFRYPADLKSAKYVVVGDIDKVWTLAQPNVKELIETIVGENWPIVWSGRYYLILANPKLAINGSS